MVVSNLGVGRVERGLSLFPARPGAAVVHVVTGLTPALTDATTREANRAAIANAINTVGAAGGGIIFIPAGHYYLQQANISLEQAAININHNNITLRGDGIGRTVLHTRSAYSVVNNKVVRGHGIRVVGTSSSSNPRRNVTLESFELDGGAGHTGNYNWPANTTTGDGWDITHKGIVPCWDDYVDGVTIRDVYVHSYRGEIIYVGGYHFANLTMQRVHVRDGNASAYNITPGGGTNLIEDCVFGPDIRFWFEITQTDPDTPATTTVRRCTFERAIGDIGIAFASLQATQDWIFTNNRFFGSGPGAIVLGGSIDSGVSLLFTDSYFEGFNGPIVTTLNNPYPNANTSFTLQNSKIINTPFMLDSLGWFTNSRFDRNDFTGRGGGSALERHCCGTITNVAVSNNIYRNAAQSAIQGSPSNDVPTLSSNTSASPVIDTVAPSVPTGLSAVGGPGQICLRWSASTDAIGVSGYRVYRDGNPTPVGNVRGPWFMDTGRAAATQYNYTVTAYDFAGNESGHSSSVQVTAL